MTGVEKLQAWVNECDNIVFFGGAGVSTESGIPDFRSVDGLYKQKYAYPPETILSHTFFLTHTVEFYDFYREKMIYLNAQPNAAHRALAQWEQRGKLRAVVTQNIDGLHQRAGSREVVELHGSVYRNYCVDCRKHYALEDIVRGEGVPRCDCGGVIRPDVVLYEEMLGDATVQRAMQAITEAQMLIVGGTSLSVYPAAGLINGYRGQKLVLINKTPTPADGAADLLIQGSIGEVLGAVKLG